MKTNKRRIVNKIQFSDLQQIMDFDYPNFENEQKIQPIIKDHVNHFKKDKWPIGVDHILSDFFYKLTGIDPIIYFIKMLAKNKIYLGIGTDDLTGSVFYLDQKFKGKKNTSKKKLNKVKRRR